MKNPCMSCFLEESKYGIIWDNIVAIGLCRDCFDVAKYSGNEHFHKIARNVIKELERDDLDCCPYCQNDTRNEHECNDCEMELDCNGVCRRDGEHHESCIYFKLKKLVK